MWLVAVRALALLSSLVGACTISGSGWTADGSAGYGVSISLSGNRLGVHADGTLFRDVNPSNSAVFDRWNILPTGGGGSTYTIQNPTNQWFLVGNSDHTLSTTLVAGNPGATWTIILDVLNFFPWARLQTSFGDQLNMGVVPPGLTQPSGGGYNTFSMDLALLAGGCTCNSMCSSAPCINDACTCNPGCALNQTCIFSGSYSCICDTNHTSVGSPSGSCSNCVALHTGPTCSIVCNGHGIVALLATPVVCECAAGWTGTFCDVAILPTCVSGSGRSAYLGSSAYDNRSPDGRIFQYSFTQANQSLPVVADGGCSPVGSMVNESMGATWNPHSVGLSFPSGKGNRLVSELDITQLIPRLSCNFTIEIWISTFAAAPAEQGHLFTIDKLANSDNANDWIFTGAGLQPGSPPEDIAVFNSRHGGPCACDTFQIVTSSVGSSTGPDSHANILTYTTVRDQWPHGADTWPMHVVQTYQCDSVYLGPISGVAGPVGGIRAGKEQTYVDATPVETTIYMEFSDSGQQPPTGRLLYPPTWVPNERIHLARSGVSNVWNGNIYSLSVYDHILSTAEIQEVYDAWLPNSLPYIPGGSGDTGASVHVAIQERVLTAIRLNGSDFDHEMNSTWPPISHILAQDSSPTTLIRPAMLNPPMLTYRLLTLPTAGTLSILYGSNYVTIDGSMLPLELNVTVFDHATVFYQSEAFAFGSDFDSFSYEVWDQISPIRVNGTIIIDIVFLDNAPVANDQTLITFAQVPMVITLSGFDPDNSGSEFQGDAYITFLPTLGTLNQTLPPGLAITSSPSRVTDPLHTVIYTPFAVAPTSDGQQTVLVDFFEFVLVDQFAVAGGPGIVTLNIANNLQPTEDTSVCTECSPTTTDICICNITLSADNPLSLTPLSFQITDLPLAGELLISLDMGSTYTSIAASDLPVDFLPLVDRLQYVYPPYYNGDSSFLFRVIHNSYESPNGTKSLFVTPVNNAPVVSGVNYTTVGFLKSVTVNITVSDIDLSGNILPVDQTYLVHITSTGISGAVVVMTINIDHISALSFTSCVPGGCLGDGIADPDMTYSGPAAAVFASLIPLTIASIDQGSQLLVVQVTDSGGLSGTLAMFIQVEGTSADLATNPGGLSNTVLWVIWVTAAVAALGGIILCVRCCSKSSKTTGDASNAELVKFRNWQAAQNGKLTTTTTAAAGAVNGSAASRRWERL